MGTPFRDLLAMAGGATVADFGVFVSGIMMGTLTFDLDDVVTKTTGGLIVLPRDHYLMTRRTRSQQEMNHIGKSACDQCSYCTEFCPRYLLGYEVMPHKVMRSLGFTLTGGDIWNQWAELCCACGLCTLYACPEDLYPKEACDQGQARPPRGGPEVRAAEAGGSAPDEGVPARAALAIAASGCRSKSTSARRPTEQPECRPAWCGSR